MGRNGNRRLEGLGMAGEYSYTRCAQCGNALPPRTGTGRRKIYCEIACRRAAERERRRPSAAATPYQRQAPEAAEELVRLTRTLLMAEYHGGSLSTLLEFAGEIAEEVAAYAAVAVQDARQTGLSWAEVAGAAKVSTATARSRWQPGRVARQLERRRSRRALLANAAAAPVELNAPRPAADAEEAERPPGVHRAAQQLASALSHLREASGLAISDLARELEVSPSHVSRVVAGKRVPTWDMTGAMATVLGADPADLRAMWEAAVGLIPASGAPSHGDAAARLGAALRGLHLAAGRPAAELLNEASPLLTPRAVAGLLAGRLVHDWRLVGTYVIAAGGYPQDIRPLWEAAHYVLLTNGDQPAGRDSPAAGRAAVVP
jgi:transcriptional regulator with XRE-family HTH domain